MIEAILRDEGGILLMVMPQVKATHSHEGMEVKFKGTYCGSGMVVIRAILEHNGKVFGWVPIEAREIKIRDIVNLTVTSLWEDNPIKRIN